jgi:hypothetical protein
MKISRPSPSMVVAGIALFVSLGGTSIAAVNYASRAGSVDGKSAVYSGATLSQAAGKLVATAKSGSDKGRMPSKFVSDVGKTQTFSRVFEVADNAPGAPQTVSVMSGVGALTATCNDQNGGAGNEDPISVLTFVNTSGQPVNVARRVGNTDGAISVAANQTATAINIGGSNTFVFHVERAGHNVMINGGVRQDGRGTGAAICGVFGVVTDVLP